MTFMEALKKFGPIAALAAGPYGPLIIAGIGIAEETGKKGADKKKIALDMVKLGAQVTNQVASGAKGSLINEDKAVAAAENTIDVIVQAVNTVKDVSVSTSNQVSEPASLIDPFKMT